MVATTVKIELPTQLYTRLRALADNEHTDVVDLLSRLVESTSPTKSALAPTTSAFQRILQRATDLGVTDLAEQHDYYLYGVEKR